MAPNLATLLGGLLARANTLAQSFAAYQKKLCEAAIVEERFALLEVRSTMSLEKANTGIHSQPYEWLHEILLPPTDAVLHDYLQSPGESDITEDREPPVPGLFDDDPAVEGLFDNVIEAEPGFENSMRELEADIRAEYEWPVSLQDAVVRLGQIVLPLLEVGNPGRVEGVIGAEVLQERQSGPRGVLRPADASIRVIEDSMP